MLAHGRLNVGAPPRAEPLISRSLSATARDKLRPRRKASNSATVKDLRYITRVDYDRAAGWWVRFKQRTPQATTKLFSDATHGGKNKALAAALEFRDSLLRKYPKTHYGQKPVPKLVLRWRTQGPWQYQEWRAEFQSQGQRLVRTFSVNRYGITGAEKRAKAWLKEVQELS